MMSDSQSTSQTRRYSKNSSVINLKGKISKEDVNNALKRRQPSFTFKQKLMILKKLENESVDSVSNEFNVNDRTLRRWKKQRAEIEAMCYKENIADHKRNRPPANQDLEDALYIWFLQARIRGIPISGTILKRKAVEINEELGGNEVFKASDGWLDNWKHRNDIRSLRIDGEKDSADLKAGNNYLSHLKEVVTNKMLTRARVFNFDETGLLYKLLPIMTLASSDESRTAGSKANEERVTEAI